MEFKSILNTTPAVRESRPILIAKIKERSVTSQVPNRINRHRNQI